MYCPKCRFEYRDGIETCPNCEVELVHLLPDLPEPVRPPRLPYMAVGAIAAVILLYIFRTSSTFDPTLIDSEAKAFAVDLVLLITRLALVGFFVFLMREWAPAQGGRIRFAAGLMVAYHALVALIMVRGLFYIAGTDLWPALTDFYFENPLSARLAFVAGFAVALIFYATVAFETRGELSRSMRAATLLACVGMVVMLFVSSIVVIVGQFGPMQMMIIQPVVLFAVFTEAFFFSRFMLPKKQVAEEPPVSATVS